METGDGESPEENPQSRKGACDTHGWQQFENRNNKIESLSDSIMDDSLTIKTTLLCNVEERKLRV